MSKTHPDKKADTPIGGNSNASERFQVKTSPPSREGATPRLPHERDESEDSQRGDVGPPRDDMKQAYRDLQEGQVDTDARNQRGIDAVVNKPPGPSPMNPLDDPRKTAEREADKSEAGKRR